MRISPALLEDFLRDYFFTTEFDLGSSGVECWTLGDLRRTAGPEGDALLAALDATPLDDTPSYGTPAARGAVADRWAGGDSGRVLISHGSSEALFLAMNALLDPDDEVVALRPAYHALDSVAAAIGCRVTPWRLRFEDGYAADLDELARLVTGRTRMVVVNFPHNPTGATITPAEQDRLVAICERAGAYLIWDGAFTELTHDGEPLPDPAARYPRALSFGTLSKAYGLPGLRFGWCIGDPALLAAFLPLRDRLTICLSPLVEAVATVAVRAADRLAKPRLEQARGNLARLERWAADRPAVRLVRPRGGVTGFPVLGVPDVDDFCHRLAEKRDTLLVPGSAFGEPAHVRLGFGGRSDLFAEGLSRLGEALAEDGSMGSSHA